MDVQLLQFEWQKIVAALLILIIGWIIAKLVKSIVKKAINKSAYLSEKIKGFTGEKEVDSGEIVSKIVYYILMLFVLVGVFQALGLAVVSQPITGILNSIFVFLPQIFGALILVAIAWVIAVIAKKVIITLFNKTKLDEKLGEKTDVETDKMSVGENVGTVVYWFIFLLFLPAILSALSLGNVLSPLQGMLDKFLGYIPNLVGAAITIVIGVLVAKLVKKIVTSILKSLNVDKVGNKTGLTAETSKDSLSEIIGKIVFVFILIPVIISGLNILGLESIAKPATDMLTTIMNYVPILISALFIIGFAYFVGKIVGELVTSILHKLSFNRVLGLIGMKDNEKIDLSLIIGKIVKVSIIFFAVLEASNIMGFSMLAGLTEQFIVLAGNVFLGIAIIGVGLYLASLASKFVIDTGSKNSKILAFVAKISIIVLSVTMGLTQMGLATSIIETAFTLILGALAVASAIAFGIGGKDMAAKKLEELDKKKE